MRNHLKYRLGSLALAFLLLSPSVLPPVLAAERQSGETAETEAREVLTISTVEDFCAFAGSCSLDAWSQGITVALDADLDLSTADFAPIPTFGGTFEGRGHTISGLRVTGAGSTQGLFRNIQPSGVVRDLNVRGTVSPQGTRTTVGGVVGENAGTLQNCSFQGTVRGEGNVGGVAGRNTASGQIIECRAYGAVSGESATGGIVGRNLGLVLKCENAAGVNLTETEQEGGLTDVNAAVLEERAAADEEAYHLLTSCSDTGGVAGSSSGVIQSCTNTGAVGYPHVGYNAGGIAGRQSGILSGCVNSGSINGRKDVGGIAGQAEPYLVVNPGRDDLDRLRRELDTLDSLINRALDDAQRTGDSASAILDSMGGFTGDARESAKQMLDRVSDFADGNIDEVNTLAADVTGALDRISPALDDLAGVGGRLETLSGQLEDALDGLDGAVGVSGQAVEDLRAALDRLRTSQKALAGAVAGMREALKQLREAVFPEGAGGLPRIPSRDDLQAVRDSVKNVFKSLRGAVEGLGDALDGLRDALGRSGALERELEDSVDGLRDAAGSSAAIGRLLRRALDDMSGAVDLLTEDGPLEFTPLGEGFREAGDGLYEALGGLSGDMEGLNGLLRSGTTSLTEDLRQVSRQFNVVFDVLLDALADLRDSGDQGTDSLIQDTSEVDIAATREGKISDCRNTGSVEGDRNVGGVVGAMAIELDPEDETADLFSFGSAYETKAVLQGCRNHGAVTARKDCVGGLAGRMDLGTALDCANYGPVTSTGGDYVGGVAGYADASVRSCCAKCVLSGQNRVGGVAGWAGKLRECSAIATITEGEEYLGAIAGDVESTDALRDNRFLDTGTAGVDGVSYSGRAEPVPFEALSQLPDLPQEFTAFTLTLLAGGETVAQIPFLYGEDLSRLPLPSVPEREGFNGSWPEFDLTGRVSDVTVEAVYTPWVTVAASQEQSGNLSLALAEGRFTGDAVLHVTDSRQTPPPEADGDAVVWDVALTGTDLSAGDDVPLRLLSPNGAMADVRQYREGRWQRVEPVLNGQYLLLTMEGPAGTFCIEPQEAASWMPLVLAAAAAAALLVIFAVVRKKRKRKKAEKKEQEKKAAKSDAPQGERQDS